MLPALTPAEVTHKLLLQEAQILSSRSYSLLYGFLPVHRKTLSNTAQLHLIEAAKLSAQAAKLLRKASKCKAPKEAR